MAKVQISRMVDHSNELINWTFDSVVMVIRDDLGEVKVLGDLYLIVHLLFGDLAEGKALYL